MSCWERGEEEKLDLGSLLVERRRRVLVVRGFDYLRVT